MRKKSIYLSIIIIFLIGNFSYSQELTPKTKKAVKKAIDKGLRFLRYAQKKEGHWDDPGITALAITAFLRSPRKYGLNDGPWIRKPLAYIAKFQKKAEEYIEINLRTIILLWLLWHLLPIKKYIKNINML